MGSPKRQAPAPSAGAATSPAFLLAKVGSELARRFRAALAPLALEPRQFALLRHVAGHDGLTQQALADALGIPKSRMVALIDDLETRGLVERWLRPEDRRARAVHLTEPGSELLAHAMRVAAEHDARLRARLTPEEHRQLAKILARLADDGDMPSYRFTPGR